MKCFCEACQNKGYCPLKQTQQQYNEVVKQNESLQNEVLKQSKIINSMAHQIKVAEMSFNGEDRAIEEIIKEHERIAKNEAY